MSISFETSILSHNKLTENNAEKKLCNFVFAGKHSKEKFFTWEERLRIAVDAALGQKVNFKLCVLTVLLTPLFPSQYVCLKSNLRFGISAKRLQAAYNPQRHKIYKHLVE